MDYQDSENSFLEKKKLAEELEDQLYAKAKNVSMVESVITNSKVK